MILRKKVSVFTHPKRTFSDLLEYVLFSLQNLLTPPDFLDLIFKSEPLDT